MGTRFLLTRESTVPDSVKQYYLGRTVADTVVTARIDGVPHRVLRTEFVDELEHANAVTSLARALRNAVRVQEDVGHVVARHGRAKASRCSARPT